jgi:tetratricopeptide (TPR) repeat protein
MLDAIFSSVLARALLLMKDRDWPEALAVLLEAEQVARRDFGQDDKRLAAVLDKLAVVYKEFGRDLDAEQAMHEATRIALLHLRRNGRSLAERQKYAEAEKAYREALRICEHGYSKNHSETATCLDNLATNLRSQSRYVESMAFCKRALDMRMVVHGENHGHTAASFSNLGHLHRLLGQHGQAQALLVKSLVIRQKVYGPDHHYVGESLDRLASLHRDLGKFDEAIEYGEQAVRIRRDKLGAEHPLTAASIHNLALSRERRVGEVVPVPPSTSSDVTPTVSPAPPDTPRENHTPGYWIIVGVVGGLAGAVVTFTYVPWIGVTAAVGVLVLGVLGLVSVVSVDAMLQAAYIRARRVFAEPEQVDRDAVVLGVMSAAGHATIEARARKGMLSAEDARELVRTGRDPLDLHFVHSLTQAAADELTKHRGGLLLNNLREVRSKLAKSLRWHKGRLELNGVPELTEAAAAHIARHDGDLCLSGLRELPQAVAKHLAHHRGLLELGGIKTISEQAAGWIIKHRGTVRLTNCRLVSAETTRILRSNPQIDFPDQRSNGLM